MGLGLLLGVFAIGVISACISFACDELSEQERQRQQELRRDYQDYEQRRREEYQETRRYFERERQEEERRYQEDLRAYQEKLIKKRKKENRAAYERMQENWALQYAEKERLLEECRKIVEDCRKSIQDQQHSNARFNSLRSTLLSLEEAEYKLEAYLRYMNQYRSELESLYEDSGELEEPFSMLLPPDYPYEGKVVWLEKKDFSGYCYQLPFVGQVWLDRSSNEVFNNSSGSLPFMVYTSPKGRQYLSLSKGMLKNSVGGTIGLDMEVLKVNPSQIILQFAHDPYFRIKIFKHDLNGQNRRTPIGSNLHVFVKEYDFALKKGVIVSERAGDGMSIAQFDSVVMAQTRDENREFYQYIQTHGLMDDTAEWRIGPCMDEHQNLVGLILQSGVQYAIRTGFEEVEEGGLILRYQGRLREEEFLSFEDAFVSSNVTVRCCSRDAVWSNPDDHKEYFEECERLRLYLTREFTVQRQILARSPMSLYLDQWLEITNRLIEFRVYGGHIRLKVDEWVPGKLRYNGGHTMLHVEEGDDFLKFQEREARHRRTRFFLELPGEDGGRRRCRVISDDESGIWLRSEGRIDPETLLEQDFTLDLYSEGNAYTERQQANAFRMFKEGQVADETIKMALIHTRDYQYTDNGHRITELFNQDIQTNPSQTDAVTRAFSEKNFFLIQGPPGTGKTTVIKEMILQQLNLDPAARIIVVSQANVAVDNVLRGIVKLNGQRAKIVRCGNEDRIAGDMEPYSFDHKFEDYQKTLRTNFPQNGRVRTLREKWLRIIEDKGNADFVGECLLGCFQIIGATCLGLENRHYGLSRMEFDLVVIDEAGKALAGELLIPINRARKVVIIGDHLQLPPVIDPVLYKSGGVQYGDVVEQELQNEFTKRSFFQRLYEDCPVASKCMLNVQFRMPPDIAELVSRFFYHGALATGENCYRKKPMFLGHHLIFLDMKDEPDYYEGPTQRQDGSRSGPFNEKELEAAAAVVTRIRTCYSGRIVIITPYKRQKKLLVRQLEREHLLDRVSVDTIDAFQGDEADVVLYCTTRARKTTAYFSDEARLNVAFSRARNTLIFLASSAYLRKYPKEHILQGIGDYLAERAITVPYARWPEIDLQFNAGFDGEAAEDREKKALLPLQNDFFRSLSQKEDSTEVCRACGKALLGDEDGLCLDCMGKVEDHHRCKCCQKPILLSYYDKYICGAFAPELCADCQDAHYEEASCDHCHKKFYLQHERHEELLTNQEEVLCPGCEAYFSTPISVGNCRRCKKSITLLRREVERRREQGERMPTFCPDCEKQAAMLTAVGYCRHCHRKISIPYEEKWHREIKGWAMPEYCTSCNEKRRDEVLIGECQICGDQIWMTYQKKWQFEEEGRRLPNLCIECRKKSCEKVDAGICDVCGETIRVSRIKYDREPHRIYDLCEKCRHKVVKDEVCVQCNERFEITYGDKQFFEERGWDLPKRCKKCRKNR